MKLLPSAIFMCLSIQASYAQWATSTANANNIHNTNTGNVGIGTTNPQQRLHVESPSNLVLFVSTSPLSSISGSGQIAYTKFLPTAAGQRLGFLLFGSRGGAEQNYHAAGVVGYAQGAWTASSYPAYIAFETTPFGSSSRFERMRIDQSGNVGIGTSDTKGYKLAVNGDAIFTKIKVKTYSTWPDYVFWPTYHLPTLQEVEAFIKQHKHLPGVLSAAEVEKEGLDVGDNQAILLKKIEELTLYLIEQDKRMEQQQQLLKEQGRQIEELKKLLLVEDKK